MRFPEWAAVKSDPSEGVDCWWIMCGAMVIGSVDGPQSDKRQEARANVLAASIDLYKALGALLDDIGGDAEGPLIENAKAALAKARGELV